MLFDDIAREADARRVLDAQQPIGHLDLATQVKRPADFYGAHHAAVVGGVGGVFERHANATVWCRNARGTRWSHILRCGVTGHHTSIMARFHALGRTGAFPQHVSLLRHGHVIYAGRRAVRSWGRASRRRQQRYCSALCQCAWCSLLSSVCLYVHVNILRYTGQNCWLVSWADADNETEDGGKCLDGKYLTPPPCTSGDNGKCLISPL